jgi:hypothetical protein
MGSITNTLPEEPKDRTGVGTVEQVQQERSTTPTAAQRFEGSVMAIWGWMPQRYQPASGTYPFPREKSRSDLIHPSIHAPGIRRATTEKPPGGVSDRSMLGEQ